MNILAHVCWYSYNFCLGMHSLLQGVFKSWLSLKDGNEKGNTQEGTKKFGTMFVKGFTGHEWLHVSSVINLLGFCMLVVIIKTRTIHTCQTTAQDTSQHV